MPEGGGLAVDIAVTSDGDRAAVIVRDHGCGIGETEMERLFTPFYTTKPRGTGLGLAVSYGIVKDHGGVIRVSSEPGLGSSFSVELPLRQKDDTR
jgi:signal transduction histidine kinase